MIYSPSPVLTFTALLMCALCLQVNAQTQTAPRSAIEGKVEGALGGAIERPAERPALRVAMPPSPYVRVDSEGNVQSVTSDLVRAIMRHIGREVRFIPMPYLRAFHAIKTGEIDMMYGIHIEQASARLPLNVVASVEPRAIFPLLLYALAERDIQVNSWSQASGYRIGSVRLVKPEQRTGQQDQGNIYYYKGVDSLTKALLAQRIDLATLEPGSAWFTERRFGVQLQPMFRYAWLQSYSLFSPFSPRLSDPQAFCQAFVGARITLLETGELESILNVHSLGFLMQYFRRVDAETKLCRVTSWENSQPKKRPLTFQ